MDERQHKKRRKGYRQVSLTFSNTSRVILGANEHRCGLVLGGGAGGNVAVYSLDGTDPGTTKGIALTTNPLKLGEDDVYGIITGPIYVGSAATDTFTAGEWMYLD